MVSDDLADTGLVLSHPHVAVGGSCDPEVDHLDLSAGRYQHVRRLEIPVNDASFVTVTDGITDLDEDLDLVMKREITFADVTVYGLAGDILHDEVGQIPPFIDPHPGSEDLCDVRMLQASQDLRLEFETPSGRLGVDRRPHDLECDGSTGAILQRLVHLTHPTATDQALDPVRTDHASTESPPPALSPVPRDREPCPRHRRQPKPPGWGDCGRPTGSRSVLHPPHHEKAA